MCEEWPNHGKFLFPISNRFLCIDLIVVDFHFTKIKMMMNKREMDEMHGDGRVNAREI